MTDTPGLSLVDKRPPPPCPEPYNLVGDVLAAAHARPDKIALAIVGPARSERWSFRRLDRVVRGIGAGLLARGLRPGDRLLLRLGNGAAFPLAYLGALAVGIVPVPTAAALTEPEITRISDLISPVLTVASEGVSIPGGVPRIADTDLMALAETPAADLRPARPDDLAYIVTTSGTTGAPRAVGHAHRAFRARRMMWEGWYGLRATDRMLHAGALNWTFTLGTGLLDPWAMGATAIVPAPDTAPEALPLLLKRHDVTIFAAAPGVYRQMLARSDLPPLPKLRHGLAAGEKLAPTIRRDWETATGTPVLEAYGQSECSTFISGAPGATPPAGTTGFVQAGRAVAVLGTGDAPAPKGTPGELAVHKDDPGLALGYIGAMDAWRARFSGPWYRTGDTAIMDAGGAVTLLGRNDDVMNAGGFRVSPLEVEEALCDHAQIREAGAVAIEVKSDTYVIAAFYVSDTEIDPSELAQFAASRLATYKIPRLYRRVQELPKSATGKLQRARLRAEYEYEARHGQT
ncbi:MAG: class I adenylate-forming enzyme family protein [Pseudomonadota bacterium]